MQVISLPEQYIRLGLGDAFCKRVRHAQTDHQRTPNKQTNQQTIKQTSKHSINKPKNCVVAVAHTQETKIVLHNFGPPRQSTKCSQQDVRPVRYFIVAASTLQKETVLLNLVYLVLAFFFVGLEKPHFVRPGTRIHQTLTCCYRVALSYNHVAVISFFVTCRSSSTTIRCFWRFTAGHHAG